MASLLLRGVRVEMNRFSKGLLLGIIVGGIFFVYLIFLLIFGWIYFVVEPLLEPVIKLVKH